jgi:uncharacterized coiled-coil protein SlyX
MTYIKLQDKRLNTLFLNNKQTLLCFLILLIIVCFVLFLYLSYLHTVILCDDGSSSSNETKTLLETTNSFQAMTIFELKTTLVKKRKEYSLLEIHCQDNFDLFLESLNRPEQHFNLQYFLINNKVKSLQKEMTSSLLKMAYLEEHIKKLDPFYTSSLNELRLAHGKIIAEIDKVRLSFCI